MSHQTLKAKQRKIIHIDMDCFYAAVEIRDNPTLADKPVAVGGPENARSVLCTCNYIARQFGVRSALSTGQAFKLCPDLIVLPVNMAKYKQVAVQVQSIFREFTDLVEPLSLDEAYLDVTDTTHCEGSATLIAKKIRERIRDDVNLTASAGVAPNKFLAKIASGWKKPDGLFVIPPANVENFVKHLPVKELYGVGKVTAEKLHNLGIKTCMDLQAYTLPELVDKFGKMGNQLFWQSKGIDNREVEANRIRKSISVETTFNRDLHDIYSCYEIIEDLHVQLIRRIQDSAPERVIKSQFVKIKFSDFKQTTAEITSHEINLTCYKNLLSQSYIRNNKSIRLLGLGVHFQCDETLPQYVQQSMF